jgi:hypothetical protein
MTKTDIKKEVVALRERAEKMIERLESILPGNTQL